MAKKTAHAEKVPVLVTFKSAPSGGLHAAAERLRKHGLKVESVLEIVGIVNGSIASGRLAALERLPGIVVERQETVQLPPPESEVQ